ncbi:MAG: rod-binding protein [Thermodesulfobacteriota bacterium]
MPKPAALPPTFKAAPLSTDGRNRARLAQATSEFEGLILEKLLNQMRRTVPKDGLFSGGFAEDVYRQMLDREMAQRLAEEPGIGIGRLLFDQLSRRLPPQDE